MAPACSKNRGMMTEDQWTCEKRLNETGSLVVLPALILIFAAIK